MQGKELNKLNIIANVLYEEPKEFKAFLADELSKGVSFPKARENAILSYLKDFSYKNILSEPNNILGIEYLKALKKYRSRIKPVLIPRKSSGHLTLDYTGSISSSTSIRNMLKTGNTANLKDALTPSSYTILKEEINNFLSVTSIKCKYKDSSNKLQDKEIKFIPSSNKLFIKDVTASSGYEIGDYVDKVLISKENSDKIIDIKLKLSKNKQIYETKFTIDIINFKGEDI